MSDIQAEIDRLLDAKLQRDLRWLRTKMIVGLITLVVVGAIVYHHLTAWDACVQAVCPDDH